MDSSSKLSKVDFLTGMLVVPAGEIEPAEWLEVINRILELCKPYLKYLPRFKPIGEYLNYFGGYDKRRTEESVMVFPADVNQKTRCATIVDLTPEAERALYDREHGVRFTTEQTLLLSQEGKLLLRELKCEREVEYRLGLCKGVLEKVKACTFTLLDAKPGLLHFLEEKPDMGLQILNSFESLVAECIGEREERLQKMEHIYREVAAIIDRIKT